MQPLTGIGKKDRERLSIVLRAAKGAISVADAARALDLPRVSTAKLLARWAQKGWLARVRRGLYVPVPLESRTADIALEEPWVIASQIYSPCYIAGWSAAEYWDLTEQIFRTVVVLTTQRPRERKPNIKGTDFLIRTISEKALFGLRPVWRGKVKVDLSDPSRTVLDMLSDPLLGGGIRSTADIFTAYLESDKKDLELLLSYASRLGNGAVFKRLGYLLEKISPIDQEAIAQCRARLTTGYVKLDPKLPADRLVTRWRLWISSQWAKESLRDRSTGDHGVRP
jgi:predicted transcriptional regulator of viral defense system